MYAHLFRAEPRAPIFEGRVECGHQEAGQICIAEELSSWHTPGLQEVDRPLWDFWVRRGFHGENETRASYAWLRTLMKETYDLGKAQPKRTAK